MTPSFLLLLKGCGKNVCCVSVLSQAIHMETDPQTISAYLIYLSQHAPVEEQASHNDLALVALTPLILSHTSYYLPGLCVQSSTP